MAWGAKAEDYAVALSALLGRNPLTSTACFHAQQCAEKYLKGLLVSRGITFPKAHDLIFLRPMRESRNPGTGRRRPPYE